MAAIFGPQMSPVMSGAIVYEWIQEANDYGIITYPDTTLQTGLNVSVGSPVPMQPEFGNLQSQWAAATPASVSLQGYTPSITTMACPATTSGVWDIPGTLPLPDTPSKENPTPAGPNIGGTSSGMIPWTHLPSLYVNKWANNSGTVASGSGTASGTAAGSSSSGTSTSCLQRSNG